MMQTGVSRISKLRISLLCFKCNYSTRSSSLVTFNSPSNNSRHKITNKSFHLIAPALWNSLPPDLRHFSSPSTTSQPNLNSPVFGLYPSVFLKKNSKLVSFTFLFLLSLTAYRLPWTDVSGIDLASLLHLNVISLSFIHVSFTPFLCYLTW